MTTTSMAEAQGYREGMCTYAKILVKRLQFAMSEAKREAVPGWEDRCVAYQLVLDGRLEDISMDDPDWVAWWTNEHKVNR